MSNQKKNGARAVNNSGYLDGIFSPAGHYKAVMDVTRKNASAMSDAMQCAVQGMVSALLRQAELITGMVHDGAEAADGLFIDHDSRKHFKRQADLMMMAYEVTSGGAQEFRKMLLDAERESGEIIQARIAESLIDINSVFSPERDEKIARAA